MPKSSLSDPMQSPRVTHYAKPNSDPQNPRNLQNPKHIDPFADSAGFAERGTFPVDSFPCWIGQFLPAVAEARKVPVSMVGTAALGIASAACGAGLRLINHLGELPANLFLIVAAETGTGKDLALNPITEPLREIEREAESEFRDLEQSLLSEKKFIEKNLKVTRAKAPTADEIREFTIRLSEIERELKRKPQLIVNDSSAQALAEVMANQPGEAIASITSEGRGPLSIIMGRFSSGRNFSDEDFFAGAYSGTPRTVNRKGKGQYSEAYRLDRPCLTILWFIQPYAYRDALAEPAMIDSGFLCRPLSFDSFAEPPIYPETMPVIPGALTVSWRKLIRELAETFRANGAEPRKIHLDADAAEILREFSNETSRARSSNGPLRDVAGIAARWGENAYRVSLVLHAMEHGAKAAELSISINTAESAVALVRWFAAETLAMLAEVRTAKREARDTRLFEVLAKAGGSETVRNLRDSRGFQEEEIEEIAERTGKIEIVEISKETGRPSTVVRLKKSIQ